MLEEALFAFFEVLDAYNLAALVAPAVAPEIERLLRIRLDWPAGPAIG